MKTVLIAGVGNVLLGDDAIGPYVIRLLESQYSFAEEVEVCDLGTPSLDLTHRIIGLRTLILVDAVASDDPPGTIVLCRKEDIIREGPGQRVDPHSPALAECLLAAEMLGAAPEDVLLVGVVGGSYEAGKPLSEPVRQSAELAIKAILAELSAIGLESTKQKSAIEPSTWWVDSPRTREMPLPSSRQ